MVGLHFPAFLELDMVTWLGVSSKLGAQVICVPSKKKNLQSGLGAHHLTFQLQGDVEAPDDVASELLHL